MSSAGSATIAVFASKAHITKGRPPMRRFSLAVAIRTPDSPPSHHHGDGRILGPNRSRLLRARERLPLSVITIRTTCMLLRSVQFESDHSPSTSNLLDASNLLTHRRCRQRRASEGGQAMQQIVELKIEETKAVVGGVARLAPAAPVARKEGGLIGEIFQDIIRVIEKDLGLGKVAVPM
jgi:hypothetical protein